MYKVTIATINVSLTDISTGLQQKPLRDTLNGSNNIRTLHSIGPNFIAHPTTA